MSRYRSLRLASTLAFVLFVVAGCDDDVAPEDGSSPGSDAGVGPGDGGDVDAGAPQDGGGGVDAGPGADAGPLPDGFDAPFDTWTGVQIEGARCGNGSTMPVAVNLHEGATEVFVYMQGGGACWNQVTCFVLGAATHIADTLSEADVVAEATSLDAYLFSRTVGPLPDASYIYIPYCTGDIHDGSNVADYGGREVHHVGGDNAQLVLDRVFATAPSPARVVLGGASAGGYGAMLNFWRARQRWPGVRVDVIDDSGAPVDPPASLWAEINAAWNPYYPPGCAACEDALSEVLPFYASTVTEPHRIGLLSYRRDQVISTFFSLQPADFEAQYDAVVAEMNTTDEQRAFSLEGSRHVVLTDPTRTTSGGVVAAEWIDDLLSDDPAWDTVGP
jgi:hypothetical protein